MLEKPDLADAEVAAYLRRGWGLTAVAVRFLPLGLDAAAWAYEVRAATGERFFLKVRRGASGPAGAPVARYLRERGLTRVVAPISTVDGQSWHRADAYHVLLYVFVDGDDVWDSGLTDDQWVEFGAFLADLHATTVPAPLAHLVPTETYACPAAGRVRSLVDRIRPIRFEDRWQREFVEFWRVHAGEIEALAVRTEELGRLARAQRLPTVLCHGDVHGANIVVDRSGSLHVVDWDAPLLAPRERDLLFVVGTGIGARPAADDQEMLFQRGYGPVTVNWPVLAYFRYQRLIEDLDEFARSALFDVDVGAETRRNDLRWVRRMFAPGHAVDLARGAERHLDGR